MVTIRTVGIIAEYNPFHNGHYWHVEQAKKCSGCDYAVAVMSGHFTQRGEPAAFDKWTRAQMAVAGGIDLVLELPVAFSVRSAQYFAAGGVRLLEGLGIVEYLAFGSENPDLDLLQRSADWHDDVDDPGSLLRSRLNSGITYAAAMAGCMANSGAPVEIISQPNNILAIEYLRAIKLYATSLKPVLIQRRHSHYHDREITSSFASATAIRQALGKNLEAVRMAVPFASFEIITKQINNKRGPVYYDDFSVPILYKLRTSPTASLAKLPDVAEGLHNKLSTSALKAKSVEELLTFVKSKRYTRTRLQRTLIHTLLGLEKTQIKEFDVNGPLYARVLAFNSKGRELLKAILAHGSIPVVTKLAHYLNSKQRDQFNNLTLLQQMLVFDTLATDIYALAAPDAMWRQGAEDFRHSPLFLDAP